MVLQINHVEYIFAVPAPYTTVQKIDGFGELEPGWCYGEGQSFTEDVLDAAIELHQAAAEGGFLRTDAFPGPNGEVRVTIYDEESYYEFTMENDGSITFVHEVNGDERADEHLSLEDAKHKIEELANTKWSSLELFTDYGMTTNSGGFRVWPLSPQAMEPVSL